MSSQVAKVNYYYFCSTLLNILFLFAIGNIVFFFIQAYCDKYEDYSYYSFDWQADHIEINLILVLIIVGSTFLSLFLHAAINCQWGLFIGIFAGLKDYLFYYATYKLSIGLYSMCNLELDSIDNLKQISKNTPTKYQEFKNLKIIFIAKLILSNMLVATIIIYLLEIYEIRNCYLIIILSFYALKTLILNIIAMVGSICGSTR
eukprot:TRINITY_DN4216_c0_g1_i3.p1 TRINITY_DN4216_c0_g1~~TRINITY_DN4216_c0_g1_i3.p1  ORF type:complete len:203 (-),score=13.44 TRINITY_DN4216_c0_g1_i3:64-672(-)